MAAESMEAPMELFAVLPLVDAFPERAAVPSAPPR
jgi:hypothetical protein